MASGRGIQHWVAGLPFSSGTSFGGRLAKMGGNLVLSDEGVGFVQLGDRVPDRVIPFADIVEVCAYADRPPRLRVTSRTGETLAVMVSNSRRATIWSKDTSARDAAVAAIEARLGR